MFAFFLDNPLTLEVECLACVLLLFNNNITSIWQCKQIFLSLKHVMLCIFLNNIIFSFRHLHDIYQINTNNNLAKKIQVCQLHDWVLLSYSITNMWATACSEKNKGLWMLTIERHNSSQSIVKSKIELENQWIVLTYIIKI